MWCPQRWNTYSWCFVTAPIRNQKCSSTDFWFNQSFAFYTLSVSLSLSLYPDFPALSRFFLKILSHHEHVLRAVIWNIKSGLPINFLFIFLYREVMVWCRQYWLKYIHISHYRIYIKIDVHTLIVGKITFLWSFGKIWSKSQIFSNANQNCSKFYSDVNESISIYRFNAHSSSSLGKSHSLFVAYTILNYR